MSKRILKLEVNRDLFEKRYSELKALLSQKSNKVKIYLDTNIFGRAIDGKMKADEASSLRRVKGRVDIDLYTSDKTRKEIENHPKKEVQDYLEFIVNLLDVIPEENFISIEGGPIGTLPFGTAPIGGGISTEDPIFSQIKEIFDTDDAEHIFQAVKSGADYFMTLDQKTILSRRKDFNKLGFNTKLVSPGDLEKILFAIEDNTE